MSHQPINTPAYINLLRGGRMAKFKGIAASMAPMLGVAVLFSGLSVGTAHAANECGPVGAEVVCDLDDLDHPDYSSGITYTDVGSAMTLTLNDPTITVGGPGVSVISSATSTGDISIIGTNVGKINTVGPDTSGLSALSVNLMSGSSGAATIVLGGGIISTVGRTQAALIESDSSGPGDLLIQMNGGDISTNGLQANALQIFQSNLADSSTADLTIQMTDGTILAEGNNSDGITMSNEGLGNSLVEMTGGSIEAKANGVGGCFGGNGSVTCFANGIAMYNKNTGSSSTAVVRVAGDSMIDVEGLLSNGIFLDLEGKGDSSVTVTGSSVVTAVGTDSNGIQVLHRQPGGRFEIVVDGTASVTGGTGNGAGILIADGLGESYVGPIIGGFFGTVEIGAGATVDGSASGSAILDEDLSMDYEGTNTTVDVAAGATIKGGILLGQGTDSLNMGGSLAEVTELNGGDDFDVLTFVDLTEAVDGAIITNWEEVRIGADASISFAGGVFTAPALFVDGGGTLNAAGGFALTGDLTNNASGTVTTRKGFVGVVVTVSGNYVGGGTLLMDVDTSTDTADTLAIGGDAPGTTQLGVTNVSVGTPTGNDITLVTVAGTATASNFVLAGGPLAAGAFDYDLEFDAQAFVLRSQGVNGTGAVYEAAPSVLGGFNRMSTLAQRAGQRQWAGGDAAGGNMQPSGAWLRFTGDRTDLAANTGTNTSTNSWGLQAGIDFDVDGGEAGNWVLGVTTQYGTSNASVTNALGFGDIDSEGYGLGLTATWYGNSGTYFDAQAQANWISSDFSSSTGGVLATGQDSTAYALSAEVGHRFELSETSALIPQAQLILGQVDGASFTDTAGNAVDLGSNSSTVGRLGLAYEYESGDNTFYAIANILHDFSGANTVDVAGASLSSNTSETWGEFGVGGSIAMNETTNFYGEVSYRQAFDNSDSSALAATAGISIKW